MTIRAAPGPFDPGSGGMRPLWRQLAGAVIRERRLAAGLRLRDVADRAGISVQYLSEVERGRKEPSSEMLESICGALDLDLLDLVRAVGGRLVLIGGGSARPVGAAGSPAADGAASPEIRIVSAPIRAATATVRMAA